MMQAAKLDSCNHLSSLKFKSQTLDTKVKDLVFALLGFHLASVYYFLTMPQFFPFGMVMCIPYYYILEISCEGFVLTVCLQLMLS